MKQRRKLQRKPRICREGRLATITINLEQQRDEKGSNKLGGGRSRRFGTGWEGEGGKREKSRLFGWVCAFRVCGALSALATLQGCFLHPRPRPLPARFLTRRVSAHPSPLLVLPNLFHPSSVFPPTPLKSMACCV